MSAHSADYDAGPDDFYTDDEQQCDHPPAAVISDVDGDHFCAACNAEWWEDPL
jgi:hypothetical protein